MGFPMPVVDMDDFYAGKTGGRSGVGDAGSASIWLCCAAALKHLASRGHRPPARHAALIPHTHTHRCHHTAASLFCAGKARSMPAANPSPPRSTHADLAYIMFTSGSTGA